MHMDQKKLYYFLLMTTLTTDFQIKPGEKAFFASDFHLGTPTYEQSRIREQKIVRWLRSIQNQASAVFLVGDIFDFWFEYKRAIPKGFARLQGTLAEFTDAGIPVVFFTGNHDLWMFDYFTKELGVDVYHKPQSWVINQKTFYVGHGDGLGPGDHTYKRLKKVFTNKFAQWLFARIHPNLGIGLADMWSKKSRATNMKKDDQFFGEDEWLWQYAKEVEQQSHHDYYIFGHRHLPLDLEVSNNSRYINLGEWLHFQTYASFDGQNLVLEAFEKDLPGIYISDFS